MMVFGWTSGVHSAIFACSIACIASCAAPEERAPEPSRATADDSARAQLLDPAPTPPPTDATHFLIETEIFELPLPLAEDLYGRADEREATIGTFPDEAQCLTALEVLAPSNPAIARAPRTSRELEIGKLETILPVPRSASKPDASASLASALASDFLNLKVRLTRSDDWPPLQLETQIVWADAGGRLLARLPSSRSPLPDGYWMEVACLPSKREAASAKTPAVFVFLRVISAEPASSAGASYR